MVNDFHIPLEKLNSKFYEINDLDFHYLNSSLFYLYIKKYCLKNNHEIKTLLDDLFKRRGSDLYKFIFEHYHDGSSIKIFSAEEHIRWMIRTILFDRDDIYERKNKLFTSFDELYRELTSETKKLEEYYQQDILIYDTLNFIANCVILDSEK